jgi:hypothetical protein
VIGLTSTFVAPLVFSPQGREAAYDASVLAQELANAAAEKGRVKAAELSSKGKQTAADLSSKANQAAADLSAQARSTASDMTGTASDMSGAATENIRKLPQVGTDAINEAQGTVSSALGDAKGYVSTLSSNNVDGNSDRNRSGTGGAASKVSNLLNSADETAKQMAPGIYTGKQSHSDHPHNAVSSFPARTGGKRTDSVADTDFDYAAAGDTAFIRGIQGRPRGAAPSAMDRVQ